MSLSEAELEQLSYREVVELAKVNGVYQKKSAKKAALIRRLSTVWTNDEINGIENVDPNRKTPLTPLKELDESIMSGTDDEKTERRRTFIKVKRVTKSKKSDPEVKSTDPPKRQNTFTKSDKLDSTISTIEEESPHNETIAPDTKDDEQIAPPHQKKMTRASKNTRSQGEKPVASLTRQNTFTKDDETPRQVSLVSVDDFPKVTGKSSDGRSSGGRPSRRNTFTKDDESTVDKDIDCVPSPKKTPRFVGLEPVVDSPKLTDRASGGRPSRRDTFTKDDESTVDKDIDCVPSPNKTPRRVSLELVVGSPKLTERASGGRPSRRSTFTTGAAYANLNDMSISFTDEIPVLQLNTAKTPAPIEKLSVFQRLSAKIPLSERRSLVMSEKRVSVKTQFFTPQSDKRSQLNALREVRKNHMTPKSLTKKMATTATKTPTQPVMKFSATSTKKSSVKKPPNFAEIHKRNFAKMESLLENKKRLRERAEFMSPGRQMSSSIPKRIDTKLGTVSSKSSGKKSNIPILQKKMAAKDRLKVAMANKCPTGAVLLVKDKKILKGVRTNKRFELQLALKKKKNT